MSRRVYCGLCPPIPFICSQGFEGSVISEVLRHRGVSCNLDYLLPLAWEDLPFPTPPGWATGRVGAPLIPLCPINLLAGWGPEPLPVRIIISGLNNAGCLSDWVLRAESPSG